MTDFHEIARDIAGAAPLELVPHEDGKRWFSQGDGRYADSWLYLLRATRGDRGDRGFLITRDGFQAGLGYRNNTVYLVRPHGVAALTSICEICQSLQKRTGAKIIIKKACEPVLHALKSESHFISLHSPDDSTLLEDEYHPELCLNLNHLFPDADTINPKAKNLRRKVKKFSNTSHTAMTVDELRDSPMTIERVRSFLSKHRVKGRAYSLIAEAVCRADSRGYFVSSVYQHSKTIKGIYVAERLSGSTAGLYCALTSKSARGMTEWMDVSFFRKLHDMGITQLLLGGCETDGVRAYCKKLLAEAPSYVTEPLVFNAEHMNLPADIDVGAKVLAAA